MRKLLTDESDQLQVIINLLYQQNKMIADLGLMISRIAIFGFVFAGIIILLFTAYFLLMWS